MAHHVDERTSEGDTNNTVSRAAWLADLPSQTRDLLAEDERWFMRQALSTPCLNAVQAADGVYLEDLAGNRLLDFHGNNVHQLGHGHPAVVAAVTAQLQRLPFAPRRYTNRPAVQLAARLARLAPGDDNWKVLFAPGAAEAVSMALKLARLVTGRYKTVSLWGSFHGATMDAIAVGGEALFHKGLGPLLPGTLHVPPYQPQRCLSGCAGNCNLSCVEMIDYVLAQDGEIGAVLIETVRNTDVQVPPKAYYQKLRAICDKREALLILDETAIALGRTGRMFASEHYGVRPDMIVLGKGLGGGIFPLAALLARTELDVAGETALGHFTHEKSPVGAAAGLATLDVLESAGLIERAARLGETFVTDLQALAAQFRCIGSIRHLGMLFAVDIVHPAQSTQPWPGGAEALLYAALARGLSFKVSGGSTLSLSPPLIIEPAQWRTACHILRDALAAVMENYQQGEFV